MTDSNRVEVDTRELEAGIRSLAAGLDRKIRPATAGAATSTAGRLRSSLPVRTGRLRSSVSVSTLPQSAAVHYGAGVPYASYIDGRTGATERATSGASSTFYAAMRAAAEAEVRKL